MPVFRAEKNKGYYEVFLLKLSIGLRVEDLMALQWDDLNFKTGELRIKEQAYRINGELLIQPPKTKASIRTVLLSSPVVEILRAYKQMVSSPKKSAKKKSIANLQKTEEIYGGEKDKTTRPPQKHRSGEI